MQVFKFLSLLFKSSCLEQNLFFLVFFDCAAYSVPKNSHVLRRCLDNRVLYLSVAECTVKFTTDLLLGCEALLGTGQ